MAKTNANAKEAEKNPEENDPKSPESGQQGTNQTETQGSGQEEDPLEGESRIEYLNGTDQRLLYAASAAMNGILAKQGASGYSPQWIAERSVELAKALIAELDKNPEEENQDTAG